MKTVLSNKSPRSPASSPARLIESVELQSKSPAPRGTCRVDVRESERGSFTEYHVTVSATGGAGSPFEMLGQLAAVLADRKIQPIQEKFYGRKELRTEILRSREAAYRRHGLDAAVPVTWIEGLPLAGGDFAGAQVWGVVPRDGEACVWTVDNPVTGRGRVWTGRGFRMLHLPAVRGTCLDGTLPDGPTAQAEQMFANVGFGLRAPGMAYPEVVRTWIYVSRLLEWYGELNRVRTRHYAEVGLGGASGTAFPASTGIQGRMDDEECLVDVLALKSDGPAAAVAEAIRCSPRQDQSFNYGSAFSRGMTFRIEGRKTVHISGTASINPAGASTHLGDAECQSLETLLSVAAILAAQGGTLHNITSATLFCKNQAAWEAWNRVTQLLQVPAFPKVCVLADVCRDDLLVELESVAVI